MEPKREHDYHHVRARRSTLAAVAFLALVVMLAAVFVLSDAMPRDPRVAFPAVATAAADAAARESLLGSEPARANAVPASLPEQAVLCTFADGAPVPSILWNYYAEVRGPLDWGAAKARHAVPATGTKFAVLARSCQIAFVSRSELPEHGKHRIDMKRSPVLDVRLLNVPPTLRERLAVQLQMSYGQLPENENIASVLMGDRAPVVLQDTDRVLIPLALPLPGGLRVHAVSRHSTHSYPTPEVRFEPVSQVIEIDLGVLAPACALADVSLTLRFPYAHPDGEMCLSMLDAGGSSMMSQRTTRKGSRQLEYRFRDLPPARLQPVLRLEHGAATPPIYLEPIDLRVGDNEVARDVVAEGALLVTVSGREGLLEDGVSVLLSMENGDSLVANWPRGNATRFEHLSATTLYAQAVAYEGQLCSSIMRVELGVAQSHEIALQLVPGGKVHVAAGAFGAAARHLDVHYAGQMAYRVGLPAARPKTFWLPLGQPRVDAAGVSRLLRVESGLSNRWP